jgi:hypothetical protein
MESSFQVRGTRFEVRGISEFRVRPQPADNIAGMTLHFFLGVPLLFGAVGFLWGAVDAKRSGKKDKFPMLMLAGLLMLVSAVVKLWPS